MAVMRNSQEALLTIVEVHIFFLSDSNCQNIFSFFSSYALLYQILMLNLNAVALARFAKPCNLQ